MGGMGSGKSKGDVGQRRMVGPSRGGLGRGRKSRGITGDGVGAKVWEEGKTGLARGE